MINKYKTMNSLIKIILSPINGVSEMVDDMTGKNSEAEQATSIVTLGASSLIKGTLKGIKKGADEIFKD